MKGSATGDRIRSDLIKEGERHAVDAYLRQLKRRVSMARAHYLSRYDRMSEAERREAHNEVLEALARLRDATIGAYGQICPACGGSGDEPWRRVDASLYSPAETLYRPCRPCQGTGRVTPAERASILATREGQDDD